MCLGGYYGIWIPFAPFYLGREVKKRIITFFSTPMQLNGEMIEFSVRLYGDVFLEIIGRGNRRQIVKLERVGRRIHWMVENFFGERPFHCLSLEINQRFFSQDT